MINVRITKHETLNIFVARRITNSEIVARGSYEYVMYCMAYRNNGEAVYNVVENIMDELTAVVEVRKA